MEGQWKDVFSKRFHQKLSFCIMGALAYGVCGNPVVVLADPAAAAKKLFTKFYRADNARRQRPDGTGIGLYLAKKVIDGHHGNIVFTSEEGKGSTFGFRLPIKKLSHPPKPQVVEG